jgi:MFS family permease
MKLPPYKPDWVRKKVSADLSEGFAYIKRTPSIGVIILILTLVSLLVLPYNTLLPVFAKVIFKGNAATFGYINSFIGLGAVAGTFFLASLKPGTDLKIILLVNTIILGFCLMLFSHIDFFPLAMLFATICGFGTVALTTSCMTIVQINSDAKMRGRVISYIVLGYFGMLPLGSLLIGAISQKIGAPNALLGQGAIALIIAALFTKFLTGFTFRKKSQEEMEVAEDVVMERI